LLLCTEKNDAMAGAMVCICGEVRMYSDRAMGSARLIGVIVPDSSNPFFAEVCQAVEAAAGPAGYEVLVVNSDDTKTRTLQHLQSLASRQVDGVLIATAVDETDVPALRAVGMRWAPLNHATALEDALTVGMDLEAGARLATQHLVDHGYRRIAFIGQAHPDDAWYRGWRSVVTQSGLEPGPTFFSPYTRPGGYSAELELVALERRPDAVFISSDMQSVGALRALHETGVDSPGDLAIVSFDGSPESEYSWPPLTTIRQPVLAMGAAAIEQLTGKSPGPHDHRRFEGELVIRRSCGCSLAEGAAPPAT
jgi:LacI family transcriptional regulator